jgi:divalent metal cation (Fe/Co/Zn/Cd) transporter
MDRTDARIRRVKRHGKYAAGAVLVVALVFGWALAAGLAEARALGDPEAVRSGVLGLALLLALVAVTVGMVWRQHHYLDRIRSEFLDQNGGQGTAGK